jgi:hypothetical protein
MQSNQFKSDTLTTPLNLNQSSQFLSSADLQLTLAPDSALLDSIQAFYVANDSMIYYSNRIDWSQFKQEYTGAYNYKKELLHQLPFDSLHTVLPKMEVVFSGKKIQRSNPDWLIGVLVIAIILFATVRLIFNKYLGQLLQSTINYSSFSRLFRERYFNIMHASFRLDVIFYIIFSLLSYQIISIYKINFGWSKSIAVYLTCLGIVIGYFFLKKISYYLLGILTENIPEVQEYLFSITAYNRVLGLFLLPVTLAIAFLPFNQGEIMMLAGVLIVFVFYVLSLLRGGQIFLKKHFSIVYLILYLCTLEFLPLLLIYNLLLI